MGLGATDSAAVASFLFCWSLARTSCLEVAAEVTEEEDWEGTPERFLRRAPLPAGTGTAGGGPVVLMELSPTVELADIPLRRAPLPAAEKL